MRGALHGVRVVDLTTVVMGPYATQLLADMGAEVIKVESAEGDAGRFVGSRPHPQINGLALNLHRNKRSLALDLRTPPGQAVMSRLLDTAALFVTNLRPSALRRMRLRYEDVHPGRSSLVYCEAHGYSTETDSADDPAYDDVIQAATGIAGLFDSADSDPAFIPSVIVDKVCGLVIANAALAALYHRSRTGLGQRVEIPMFDTALAFNLVEHLDAAAPVPPLGPPGYARVLSPHRRPYRSADGWVTMLPYMARDWRSLWAALGRDDIVSEIEPLDAGEVMARAASMYEELSRVSPSRTTQAWLDFCAALGIAASAVRTLDELVSNPAFHRGVLRTLEHPVVGPYQHIASPIRMSGTPAPEPTPAPMIGEHTLEILAELGYSEGDAGDLVASGVVAQQGGPAA